jgi:Skp family chaperone for outer membrane proteins
MAIQNKLENEKHTINETLQTLEKKISEEKSKLNF